MTSDSSTDTENTPHVFDETGDPTAIVDSIDPDPIFECEDCGHIWNGVRSEYCPECSSDTRTKVAEETIFRAKWTADGAESIDQAISKFEFRIAQLEALQAAGWEINTQVTDDYAYIRKSTDTDN